MTIRRIQIGNRGYMEALRQIEIIMANKEVVDMYNDFCDNVTEGDRMAAAILTLVSIRLDTGKVIEHMQERDREGSVAS